MAWSKGAKQCVSKSECQRESVKERVPPGRRVTGRTTAARQTKNVHPTSLRSSTIASPDQTRQRQPCGYTLQHDRQIRMRSCLVRHPQPPKNPAAVSSWNLIQSYSIPALHCRLVMSKASGPSHSDWYRTRKVARDSKSAVSSCSRSKH